MAKDALRSHLQAYTMGDTTRNVDLPHMEEWAYQLFGG